MVMSVMNGHDGCNSNKRTVSLCWSKMLSSSWQKTHMLDGKLC